MRANGLRSATSEALQYFGPKDADAIAVVLQPVFVFGTKAVLPEMGRFNCILRTGSRDDGVQLST